MKLEVNDRIRHKFGGGQGTIVRINPTNLFPYIVKWDNSTHNWTHVYERRDLELVK